MNEEEKQDELQLKALIDQVKESTQKAHKSLIKGLRDARSVLAKKREN